MLERLIKSNKISAGGSGRDGHFLNEDEQLEIRQIVAEEF